MGGEGPVGPARILVVDDTEVVARFAATTLSRAGHTAVHAFSGRDALTAESANSGTVRSIQSATS